MNRLGCDRCKGSPRIGVYWLCPRCKAKARRMFKRIKAKAQTHRLGQNHPSSREKAT